ncbi:MAG: transcription-repair coupling factor [Bacteroidales bacterium]|nr:transcription-repair coupling factor [Bacteroidales bacterium]
MTIAEFKELYAKHPKVEALCKTLAKKEVETIYCKGLTASSSALVASQLIDKGSSPFLFILEDLEEAGYFYQDLNQILGEGKVLFYPSSYRRAIKYGQKDAANEVLRTEVLSQLQKKNEKLFIVTYPEALAEKVVSKEELNKKIIKLDVGQHIDPVTLREQLYDYGFEFTDYVYEPGQFAIRGSIIDIFSYSSEIPFRIDFFGDEIDSIRSFEVESQLSVDQKKSIVIVPNLELSQSKSVSFFNSLAKDTIICAKDIFWTQERIVAIHNEALLPQAVVAQKEEQGESLSLEGTLLSIDDFNRDLKGFKRMEFGNKATGVSDAIIEFSISPQPIFHKNFDLVTDAFTNLLDKGYALYICSDSSKQTERLQDIFKDRGDTIPFTAVSKTIHAGFSDHNLKISLFTDHQIFDRYHKYTLKSDKTRSGKMVQSIKELHQFTPGDYVIHSDHGVGRFDGLVRLPIGDTVQEVIKLVYLNDDVVFVSIHSLHKISKYRGKEGEEPRLNKLGTGAWQKLKDRTKNKLKDIARDLIKLYAKRREEKGFAFSPDTYLQRELEASFVYEDTPDQSKATADVKSDMEQNIPMDRLICGDVGFGKTEVAIRAAFKAVTDNKQVAVLVPTTVLAYQHFQTFSERLNGFPCNVEYLSRARTTKEKNEVIKGLKSGSVDIIIGTHRILGKDVKFKDLGLLIVDEEQKFGVSVKEKLRLLKVNVDTLTLTATPIPRTLQFSLMGARDLSIISTPPPNRYPIQTEIHTFNKDIIVDAVNFEMSRNGQIFFVNNRISGLPEIKSFIEKNIPDCRVAIGHGQMDPVKMEKVILDFVHHEYDVLLATTIIESGIDIPNANTIIINNAHNFGLSDLHQMRGRVGRSNKKAFCYLLAPPLTLVSSESKRRLQAIENFSDLGSGFHIAMQDLDIRGAGNMLGAEQSGFIADLGYETYQKILTQAVQELKEDEFSDLYEDSNKELVSDEREYVDECQVESDLELLLPDNYVTGSSERMSLYSELDELVLDDEVEVFERKLQDRFGPIPEETSELLKIVPLRRMAKRLGIERIFLKGGQMILFFVSNDESPFYQSEAFGKIISFAVQNPRRCDLREKRGRRSLMVKNINKMHEAVAVLQEIVSIQV